MTRWRRVPQAGWIAVALTVLQLAVRGWAVAGAWFWQDDFMQTDLARRLPLRELLLSDYNGHWQPGQQLVIRWLAQAWPLEWAPHAAVLLGLQLVADLAVWWLLTELVGRRRAVVVPYALYLFSPLTVSALLWFAAGIQSFPLQITLAVALACHVRLWRLGSRRWGIAALAAFVVGLAFWEKALLIPVAALVLDLAVLQAGSLRQRLRNGLLGRWRLWAGYLVLSATYLLSYVAVTSAQPRQHLTVAGAANLAWETSSTLVVTMVGGPWRGLGVLGTLSQPASHPWDWIAWQVLLAALVLALLTRGARALLPLLLPAAVLVLDMGSLALSRFDFLGGSIGRDTRYVAELSVLLAVAVSAMFLDLRPRHPDHRPAPVALGSWIGRVPRTALLGVLLIAYLNSAMTSTAAVSKDRQEPSARKWVANARASLGQPPAGTVLDTRVPLGVLNILFPYELARTSLVLGSLPEAKGRIDRTDSRLLAFDDAGLLQPVDLPPGALVRQGPQPVCGWEVPPGEALTLTMPRVRGRYLLRLAYFSDGSNSVRVDVGGQRFTVALDQAAGQVYLFPDVAWTWVDTITISGVDAGRRTCLTDVAVAPIR